MTDLFPWILSFILLFLLVIQQFAWMFYANLMVKKAMARDLREFHEAEKTPSPREQERLIALKLPKESESFNQADQLNQLMGLGQKAYGPPY